MTVSPFEIMSIPSIGTYFSAMLRRDFELILKISFVATVITASSTPLNIAILGVSIFVNDASKSRTLSSTINIVYKD